MPATNHSSSGPRVCMAGWAVCSSGDLQAPKRQERPLCTPFPPTSQDPQDHSEVVSVTVPSL